MGTPLLADVQYNDLRGAIAIDGHDGPPLEEVGELVPLPPGYRAFAFELFRLDPIDNGRIPLTIMATRTDEVGETGESLIAYERQHGSLPVYRFSAEIEPNMFPSIFKRIDIVVTSRHWTNLKVDVRDPSD